MNCALLTCHRHASFSTQLMVAFKGLKIPTSKHVFNSIQNALLLLSSDSCKIDNIVVPCKPTSSLSRTYEDAELFDQEINTCIELLLWLCNV